MNLQERAVETTIDGNTLSAKLPADLKDVRYIGYYVKATSIEFAPLTIETGRDQQK